MRILMIIPCLPEPPDRGSLRRYAALVAACRKAGSVTCVCLTDEPAQPGAAERFARMVDRVMVIPVTLQPWRSLAGQMFDRVPPNIRHWLDPVAITRLRQAVPASDADLVVLGDLVMIPYADAIGVLDRPFWIDRSRVDAVYQDLVHQRETRTFLGDMRHALHRRMIHRYERMAARRCAGQIVCAPSDRIGLREVVGHDARIEVIANGIEPADFPDQGDVPDEPVVLFPGTFDYEPNIDGAQWFVEHMWAKVRARHPAATFVLAGRSPVPSIQALHGRDGIVVTGSVDSMLPWYRKARCIVCPIRIGGGTRLKVVEAWAVGRPQVATTIAVDGLAARDGENCLIRDDAAGFAEALCQVLAERPLVERIRAHALRSGADYTWDGLMAPLPGMLAGSLG